LNYVIIELSNIANKLGLEAYVIRREDAVGQEALCRHLCVRGCLKHFTAGHLAVEPNMV